LGYKEKRKLIHVGKSSRAVIMPKPWLDYHGERAEHLTLLGNSILIVVPQGLEEKAQAVLDAMDNVGVDEKKTRTVPKLRKKS